MAKPRQKKQSTPPVGVPQPSNAPKFIGGAAVLIALCLVVALFATQPWKSDESGPASTALQYQPVSVEGQPLPAEPQDQSQGDPAIGAVAPNLTGKAFDGAPSSVTNNGKPKALFFLAHWCPHCQDEIPVITDWIKKNGAAYDVEYVGIPTGTNPRSANYPPSEWFNDEGWPAQVLVDSSNNDAANAYGLGSYPYMVFLDKDNKVVARVSDELPEEQITAYMDRIATRR